MPVPKVNYTYKASFLRAVDGDTIDIEIDLGFRGARRERLRLARIDCPEMRPRKKGRTAASLAKEKDLARQAEAAVLYALDAARIEIMVQTSKSDVFGRWLAEVWYRKAANARWTNLSDQLMKEGLAKPWKGKTR